jgi:hypothetical protein
MNQDKKKKRWGLPVKRIRSAHALPEITSESQVWIVNQQY